MSTKPATEDPAVARTATEADRVREPLRRLYAELDRAVAEAGPRCRLSGRCCRFAEYGHTLFLSEIEAAVLLADAPAPVRPLDDGASCPWQDPRGHCTAREARPLGCRVYYCEPSYQETAGELSEAFLGRLQRLAEELGRPWNYAPLHRHLRAAQADGRFPNHGPRTSAAVEGSVAIGRSAARGQSSPDCG